MRRIVMAGMSTLSGLVLLFSYHTSRNESEPLTSAAEGTSSSSNTQGSDDDSDSNSSQSNSSGSNSSQSNSSESGSAESSSSGKSSSSSGASKSKSGSSSSGIKTYLGKAINTRYGPVQVQIEVSGGKITTSNVTQVPWNDRRDQQINGYAVPQLNQAAVDAQGTGFDSISGATYTSEAYKDSLQSALDKAGI